MANCLKKYLSCLISEQQSAFVLKRLITDNALMASEVFHYMKRKTSGRRGTEAIKLDMSKACDREEWNFLCGVLEKIGFNQEWVNQVSRCISSVSYSFMINGKIRDTINLTRGIRQGDPIPPYLFLLYADTFFFISFQTLFKRGKSMELKCMEHPIFYLLMIVFWL